MGWRPGHSHSIVSGTYKYLKVREFISGCAAFTVTSTAKNFRLRAIDGDRSRLATTDSENPRALIACVFNYDVHFDANIHLL
jgi:hypothetical protein